MKGIIKKDLLMIKNNYKSILITLVLYVFYSLQFDMNMTFFLPFMGFMICISTFSYDDYNNWHSYAATLPYGKINIVRSKYIVTIFITISLTIISMLLNFVLFDVGGDINIKESLSNISGELFALIFMMSLLFPILFKYGSEKGRIAMITIGFGLFGLVLLFSKIINVEIPYKILLFIDSYFIILFIFVSIILIGISYCISKKIYLKREF